MITTHTPLTDEEGAILDDLSKLVVTDDFDAIRARYLQDDRLRVPPDITSFINGILTAVHLEL
jgi:hypothetical protein